MSYCYICFDGHSEENPLMKSLPCDCKGSCDGLKHGPYFEFVKLHENYNQENMYVIQRQGTFVHGVKQGTWYLWKPDGTISMQTQYLDGIHHGEQKRIMDNGQVITWTPTRTLVNPSRS